MAMGWMVQDRAAARHVAALAAIIAAVLPAAGCTASGPMASSAVPAVSGVPASGHWGSAVPVPGLGGRGLNAGGQAWVSSVSCASAGNCALGGSYRDGHRHGQRAMTTGWASNSTDRDRGGDDLSGQAG